MEPEGSYVPFSVKLTTKDLVLISFKGRRSVIQILTVTFPSLFMNSFLAHIANRCEPVQGGPQAITDK